ncbi:RHS repeat-associated core domain-containing protein [Chryseobacterium wanjuense]|uniref:RHS repeat-associated core domain-containing protein n=1 Tax=Chryseobacterium wanjuense TaxID=356305 RepID=A0A1I0S4M5_9FLAO|nr:DUF6443 domain-containing protein [Chryseobacterium wanjuense]SEW49642.1 RHS repeat-associated core domain-containing protein [Chryseobacterium wanjuense]
MKKILIPFNILFVAVLFHAQTTTENYIQTRTYLEPVTSGSSTAKQIQTVQYFDGLGRPKQVVNVKASPSGRDVVTHIEYDGFGRQVKEFLPVPQSQSLNGAIIPDPLTNATQPDIYGAEKIYSEKILESSPIDKILQQKQVGNAWDNKPIQFTYDLNIDGEVKNYTVITVWTNKTTVNTISLTGTYNSNQLYKNTVTDEDGNATIEFKNGRGQTILVRKNDGTKNVDTYYVYDNYQNLAYVIPPLASASSTIDQTVLDNLCYQYRYDIWDRLIEKKLPGKGWEYMLYDKQDRLVATQDTELKNKGQWLYTKYDQFGRVAITGIGTGYQRSVEQTTVDTYTSNNVNRLASPLFNRQGMDVYYGNQDSTYPNSTKWVTLLSLHYYDSYPQYSFNPAFPSTILGEPTLTETPTTEGLSTKSLPVMSLVKNIEDDNWTKSYSYYDKKGRAIGTYSINHLGGYTKTESKLDFAGVALQTKTYHKRLSTDTERIITENFEYDAQNRLKKHYHQVDSQPQELLTENSYNELSQLTNKKVGNNLQSIDYAYNIRGWMTKINDPANLAGKLFGYKIKYNEVEGLQTPNSDYPGLQVKPRYNGNIAEVDWKTATDPNDYLRRYGYVYDGLNRLSAGFYQREDNPSAQEYFEKIDYDLNGNILNLKRSAAKGANTVASLIDNLTYTYARSNRLNTVTDSSTDYRGYPDTSGGTIGYNDNGSMTSQPDKGILQIDYNVLNLPKYIKFNQFIEGRGGAVYVNSTYSYRADGSKTGKVYTYKDPLISNALATTTTDYLDGFQYEAKSGGMGATPVTLQFVPTAEGYYNFENNKYIYSYTDHLGNVRLSYFKNTSGSAEVLEENNYYPFGMKHEGYNNALVGNPAYKYQYNGKEYQTETGWNDYGARMYMSDIGRWGVVDPLAEKMRRYSPYNYAFNNPLRFIDPDGRAPLDDHFNKNGRFMYRDDKKTNNIIVHTDQGNAKLSQLDYSKKGTRMAVSNIIAHYATQKGLTGYYGVSTKIKNEDTGAVTSGRSNNVFYNSKQLAKGSYNNLYDLRNTLDHEAGKDGHKNENKNGEYTFLAHAKVYLGQSKTSDYENSTEANQYSVAFGFAQRLWNAYKKDEISWEGMDPYLEDFNRNNTGGVQISTIGGYEGDPMEVVIKNDTKQSIAKPVKKMTNPHD